MIINPYKHGSRGAKALQGALKSVGVPVWVFQRIPNDPKSIIINWGNSEFDYSVRDFPLIVNSPYVVGVLTNKRKFFKEVGHTDLVPKWTTDPLEAFKWNTKVMARMTLEGSGGKGIVVYDPEIHQDTNFPKSAPLYTKYENKTHEFRVHIARTFYGREFAPILVQRKIFRKSVGMEKPKNWDVRNHSNGFIYVRESGFPTPSVVIETAKCFMTEFFPQLHFVALDIIYHEKTNRAFVLEGNTAPGLEGNTVQCYAEYFKSIQQELT